MNQKRFEYLVKQLREKSFDTLIVKNANYAPGDDCLHNFKSGADIIGGTPAQAGWGYMAKHLVALRDKVERDDFSDKADLLEKCQDIINYIIFIWCIAHESDNCVSETATYYYSDGVAQFITKQVEKEN